MKVEFNAILNKPYFIQNVDWTAATPANSNLIVIPIPSGLLNNPLVRKPFESTSLYRTKLCIIAQVSGTPMHSGTVLMAAMPLGYSSYLSLNGILTVPSLMAAPHCFLSANEASSVCLEVPFYSGTELIRSETAVATSNVNLSDYAELHLKVLNTLGVPTSGSTTLSISIHAMFIDSEFYIPHVDPTFVANSIFQPQSEIIDQAFNFVQRKTKDFLDQGRKLVTYYTGLHNPNVTAPEKRTVSYGLNMVNAVDKPSYFESLNPYHDYERVANTPIFRTNIDEMSVKYVTSKPAYLQTFNVDTTTPVGKVLFSRPITPNQSNLYTNSPVGRWLYTPLEIISSQAAYWKGGFKLHIQAAMTNFHYCKLLVVRNYSPVLDCLTKVPSFSNVQNMITDTLEFSSGGQVQTVDLPYFNVTEVTPISYDHVTNAMQHGMYYIYLMQPLVANGAVPLSVQFNVYISTASDFGLYGYGSYVSRFINIPVSPPALLAIEEEEDVPEEEFQPQSDIRQIGIDPSAISPVGISDPHNIMIGAGDEDNDYMSDNIMRPILSIRDIGRRMTPVFSSSMPYTGGLNNYITLRISDLLGLTPQRTAPDAPNESILSTLFSLYRGFCGGLKLRVVTTGAVDVNVYYIPPSMRVSPVGTSSGITVAKSQSCDPVGATTVDADAKNLIKLATVPNNVNSFGPFTIAPFKVTPDIPPVTVANITQTHEFVIPNMSPMKFIGDLNLRGENTNSYLATDLGSLIISYDPTGTGTASAGIKISAGLSDEARFGHQNICIPRLLIGDSLVFPAVATSFLRTIQSTGPISTATAPSLPYLESSIAAPAVYITL
jgi:hypothetical protein